MTESHGCIYKATNLINGKIYVGQHFNTLIRKRINSHIFNARHGKGGYFHRAIRLYGEDNFLWEIIWTGPKSLLSDKERFYIRELKSNVQDGRGYNLTEGGEGTRGYKASMETRKKLSDSHKGIRPSAETLIKLSISRTGKTRTEETRRRISEGLLRAHRNDPSWAKRISENAQGRTASDETRIKIGTASSGRRPWNAGMKMSPEFCAVNSSSHLGIKRAPFKPETIERMSAAAKKREEVKRAMRAAIVGVVEDSK